MKSQDRRVFVRQMLAVAGVSAANVAVAEPNPGLIAGDQRQKAARYIRDNAAMAESVRPIAPHPANGDETAFPTYIASFSKGLPHSQLGEVVPAAYQTLLHALSIGKQSDFESLDRGSGTKLVNPQGAYAITMEAADSHRLGTTTPPTFSSPDAAGEMVELYWQALARDVPFTDYDASPITQKAVQDLNGLSAFHGPTAGGKVTTRTLFRGNVDGGLKGPFISQFFWQPIPMNSTLVQQRYRAGIAGVDYLTTYDEWLVLQSGVPPYRAWAKDPTLRYIFNGRALAEWVHYDFLYQAFHNAALILLNQSPDTVLNVNPYLNPTNPYKSTRVETGFVTFGGPHICNLLGTVSQGALCAAWFQKWLVHRRLRPEEFAGRVQQAKAGNGQYPIHGDLMSSAALKAVHSVNGSYLLPQAFPEGCPLHPSYPAGHATVAGACATVLKAFFDETQIVTNCVEASRDGLSLVPYGGVPLTVGGEVNKLAFNVAMGRNFAGIHYRSDSEAGFSLGEDVAIAMLEELVNTFSEDFPGFQFTRLDGTPVQVVKATRCSR
jgi:hypothetical protein